MVSKVAVFGLVYLFLLMVTMNQAAPSEDSLEELFSEHYSRRTIFQSKCYTPCGGGKLNRMCSWCSKTYKKNMCCEGGFFSGFTSYCANAC